jgi:hypothetical protein
MIPLSYNACHTSIRYSLIIFCGPKGWRIWERRFAVIGIVFLDRLLKTGPIAEHFFGVIDLQGDVSDIEV